MCVPKRACFAIAHFHLRATEQISTLPRATCPFDRLALRLGFAMQGILNPSATKAQADCLALTYQTSYIGFYSDRYKQGNFNSSTAPSPWLFSLSREASPAWSQGLLGSHSRVFCFHASSTAPQTAVTYVIPARDPARVFTAQGPRASQGQAEGRVNYLGGMCVTLDCGPL